MRKIFFVGCALLCLLLLNQGCTSNRGKASFSEASIREILSGASVVGGGFVINWQAPAKGTAILVEEHSNRNILTRSLAEGDSFEFNPVQGDREQSEKSFTNLFGIGPEKANLLLFFKPVPAQ